MTSSPAFWDRIATRYSKQPIADEAAYQKKLEKTREHFRPDMQVLELGCGTGSTAIMHAPHVGHLHATDISPKMIEIAKDKASSEQIDNLSFEVSSLDDLSVEDQSQDMVLALSVLHLLEDRDEAIARVHKMLKPDGLFVTSTACMGDTMNYFKYIAPIGAAIGVIPMVRVFTVKELENSLTAGGFRIEYQWQPGRGKSVFIIARKA